MPRPLMGVPTDLRTLPSAPPAALLGRWHIVQTTFPMWLRGGRYAPSLNYLDLGRTDAVGDEVQYTTNRGPQTIRGVDLWDAAHGARYVWRGSGWLALLRSEWFVVHLDAEAGVAAIFFQPTIFTPDGVDVIARAERPAEAAVQSAIEACRALPSLRARLPELAPPARDPSPT